jgi:type IV pilus assembly protein PilC
MKIPIVGKIIINREVGMFTKTFASLLHHNVFYTDSMAILSQVSSNEVFSDIINRSLEYLTKGARISDAFKNEKAFPVVAYEMLVTGENTGRLPVMMEYVANYYNDLYSNMIKRLNTFIEPILIVFLATIVGLVILSVIIPMFSFYSQIQ